MDEPQVQRFAFVHWHGCDVSLLQNPMIPALTLRFGTNRVCPHSSQGVIGNRPVISRLILQVLQEAL